MNEKLTLAFAALTTHPAETPVCVHVYVHARVNDETERKKARKQESKKARGGM